MRVKNKKAIRNLSDKSFRAAGLRNGIAMAAIALTAILFTSLFTIGFGLIDSFQYMTARQAGGDGHGAFKYLTQEEYEKIKSHPLIKKITYNRNVADSVDNPAFLKRHVELYQMDEAARESSFINLPDSQIPKKADDIAMDTKSLDLLGIPHEIGRKVTLSFTVQGKKVEREFTLCGFWESDPLLNVGFGLVSPAYCETYASDFEGIDFSLPENASSALAGAINSYVFFSNTFQIQEKLNQVLSDCGYSSDPQDSNFIDSNANWSYLSSGFDKDPTAMAAVLGILFLITLTGYLIIYNIFQISVIQDIRFYGLLKTIGTTRKQIKTLIQHQAFLLSIVGIPIGLIFGFLIGKAIVPKLMVMTSFGLEGGKVSFNPVIFIGAALFTLLTVLISVRKPAKIAAKVSPVEAVRYTEGSRYNRKRKKKSTDGGKIYKMAFSNLGRNKKKTFFVLLSMSLSVILLNSVLTFTKSFDIDKYMSNFSDTDFLIGRAKYFNNEYEITDDNTMETDDDSYVTPSFIKEVQKLDGFLEGGSWYCDCSSIQLTNYDFHGYEKDEYGYKVQQNAIENYIADKNGNAGVDVYGADPMCLDGLDIISDYSEKEIKRMLASGHSILEGVDADEGGTIENSKKMHQIGDTVVLKNTENGIRKSYEVIGYAAMKYYTNTCRRGTFFSYYLPAKEFQTICDKKKIMTYAFNVEEGAQKEAAAFLKDYTDTEEPTMSYEAKLEKKEEFKQLKMIFVLVGGSLSLIIGLIGILNFVNSILTGLITRRREFAMLESVGMTKKQLTLLVVSEGIYYGVGTAILVLTGGIGMSIFAVRILTKNLWFCSYRLLLWPLFAAIPILLLLGIFVPCFAWNALSKGGSLVERMRAAE
ncbi:MAG: ABC transporter permease [Lachnospiraceae bacterium]|nr:ABC transporter permease [Lachnospiraceae bacterium]